MFIYLWLYTIIINFFRRFAYHSQHPQGSWDFRCLVFPQQYRAVVHWIRGPSSIPGSHQITLLSLLFKLSFCARLTRALLLVRDVTRHGVPTPSLKKPIFYFFQILVLSYEPFISLPFFSHCPGDTPTLQEPSKSDGEIIFCVQSMLDLFKARDHPP